MPLLFKEKGKSYWTELRVNAGLYLGTGSG